MPRLAPHELAEIFDHLRQKVKLLFLRWRMFQDLYQGPKLRTDLLNESAGTFFAQVYYMFLDDFTLTLSRLIDVTSERGKDHMVLELLVRSTKDVDVTLHRALNKRLKELRRKCDIFKQRRNTIVAHADRAVAMKAVPGASMGFGKRDIEGALWKIQEFMNEFEGWDQDATTSYDPVAIAGGVESLIAALAQGAEYRLLINQGRVPRHRLLQKGKYLDALQAKRTPGPRL